MQLWEEVGTGDSLESRQVRSGREEAVVDGKRKRQTQDVLEKDAIQLLSQAKHLKPIHLSPFSLPAA